MPTSNNKSIINNDNIRGKFKTDINFMQAQSNVKNGLVWHSDTGKLHIIKLYLRQL